MTQPADTDDAVTEVNFWLSCHPLDPHERHRYACLVCHIGVDYEPTRKIIVSPGAGNLICMQCYRTMISDNGDFSRAWGFSEGVEVAVETIRRWQTPRTDT